MEWKFAWSSIITGIILVTSIIFIRLTIDLYTGWNVYMILRPLFFYTLLVISGINLLVNRKCAIFLYKFFSWGIVVERILFVYLYWEYIELNSSYKCNGIHINNLFKFFVWCEVSKSFTRSII